MTRIAGNTFPVRQRLLAMGGKWIPADCLWEMPDEATQEALTLVMAQGERPAYSLARTPKRYGIVDLGANQTHSRSFRDKGASRSEKPVRKPDKAQEPTPDGMVRVTEGLFEAGKSLRGGWSRKQLALLGVPWPLVNGWKLRVLGTLVSTDRANKFVKLSNRHPV